MPNKLDCLKLINFIENSTFFTTHKIKKKKILIAFSGGQDSTCLLTIFYILSQKWDFELGAVYCNHCWKEARETSLAVFENLQLFDIPFYFVEAPNSKPMKPEQQARNWRYSSFYTILKNENYDFLLTGHTLSDYVETVLFNLFRGCGLNGICSLKELQTLQMFKKNAFCFKKTIFFPDPFFYLIKKNENCFLRKYNFFKTFCPVQNNLITTNFLLIKNQSQSFGLKQKTYFDFTLVKSQSIFVLDKKAALKLQDGSFVKFQNFFHSVDVRFFKKQLPLLCIKNAKFDFLCSVATKQEVLNQKKLTKLETFKRCLKSSNKTTSASFELKEVKYLIKQNFKPRKQKQKKLINNLFYLYLKKLKEFQKTDKLSSFITFFKPSALKKNSQKKKFLNSQIQRIIRKKAKEKAIPAVANFNLMTENKNFYFSSLLDRSFDDESKFNNQKNFFKRVGYKKQIEVQKHVFSGKPTTKENFLIFRPFLKINREILFLFSKNLKLYFHYDNSNKNLNLTRNYIRKVLIPLIKKINPRAEENIYKFSRIIEFYSELVTNLKLSPDDFDIFKL